MTSKYSYADDLRVEQIATQLEESEQQRLTDDWIEEATLRATSDWQAVLDQIERLRLSQDCAKENTWAPMHR
jgi:hypothetical protein